MSMMAYPSFLKVITGYLSRERRRGSKRERFSSRAATLAGHRGGAGCPRQCRPPHSGKSASRKRTSCDGEREERCDAANADDHFVGNSAPGCIPIPSLVHLMNYEGGRNRLRPDMFCLGLPLDFLLAPFQS